MIKYIKISNICNFPFLCLSENYEEKLQGSAVANTPPKSTRKLKYYNWMPKPASAMAFMRPTY